MELKAGDLRVGDFFAVPDRRPPNNVFIVRVVATALDDGLCQRLSDKSFWAMELQKRVKKIPKTDYNKSEFYV